MAGFNYMGFARIQWLDKPDTRQYVSYDMDDDTLMVWPVSDRAEDDCEYYGSMAEHTSEHIHFNQ